MRKYFELLIMFLGLCPMLMAQNIQGVVTDTKGMPISFANVVELLQADSSFVKGTVSKEDGTFMLEDIKTGNVIRVSLIGYETQYINYTGQNTVTLKLQESTNMLGEVVVKSSLPKTVLRGEGMITNIEGSVLEKTSNMEQLLSRIPNVSAKDGQIEVFGRGTPVIFINGRKMQDQMDLQRLQPSNIKKIEVINNPGARYDASVRSVIRITTKKMQGDGFSFDNKTTFSVNEEKRLSSYESFQGNYRKGGLDVNGFLYGAYTHTPENKQVTQYSYITDTWQQNMNVNQEFTNINPYARLGVSYMLGEESNFGASFSYNRFAKDKGEGTQTFNIMQNNVQKESSIVDYLSPGQSTTYSANAYYVGKIGGLNVDFNTDYYWYGKKQWMDLHETVLDEYSQAETEKSDVCSYRNNRNSLLASKLVLSIPLLNGTFSLGGEYSQVNRRSHYQVEPEVVDNEKEKVKESMTSAFVDYSRRFGQLALQAGLRYEYIDFDYYNNELYIAEQSKTYGNWFPSLALSLPVGKTQMQLTYAADIYRPSYNELRSGVQYDNQYTYESGNPFLVPSITRNLTYAFSWKWVNLQLVYSHISDEVCTMTQTYRDDPMKSLARPENINSYNSFQAGLTLNPTFGIWHPTLETMLYKQWLKMDTHVGKKLANPVAVFQLTNTFDFKWLTASLVTTAQTEGNMGNKYIRQGYSNTDLSLYKSLLKNRLTLTLDVSDVFGTGNQHRTFYSGVQRTLLYDLNSTSTITFSIRYRFNATNSKYKGTGAGQSQKNRM